jgi:anti-sigma regulatory factor (Ser/Thr protein kinase)
VSSRFCIEVPAAPGAVPGARRAITRFCEHLGLGRELADRIRLATTEACTNCVLHAYDFGAPAPTVAVEARVEGDTLVLVVRDHGEGIRRSIPERADALHLGLRIIEELADSTSVISRPGRGTRVSMRFALTPAAA